MNINKYFSYNKTNINKLKQFQISQIPSYSNFHLMSDTDFTCTT